MLKKTKNKVITMESGKYVFQCILCNYKYIGRVALDECPACRNKGQFAIRGDFIVTK